MYNVVIVGRMNVGKSTFFNRLVRFSKSITLDYEGVTRDFIKDKVNWAGKEFNLIDTGGISLRQTTDEIFEKVRQKVFDLLEKADIILFMVDGLAGLLAEDIEITKFLRKLNKPVIVIVNKIDNLKAQENLFEFQKLGFKNIIGISAEHGLGINDLLDSIINLLPKESKLKEEEKPTLKVVFLGKPNVGKSSLMNLMLNEERSIVSDIEGTTREAISESIMFYKQAIELTDTPGIRRQRSVKGELEPLMVKSAFGALKDSDIVVLLIDGSESSFVDQELKLAFYSFEHQHKALIILVNKSDIITDSDNKELETNFDYYKHLIKNVPVLQISCKTGKNVGRILPLINEVWLRYSQKFDDKQLTRLFSTNLQKKPVFNWGQKLQINSANQIATAPITILVKVREPRLFDESKLKFFENLMRSEYDMKGVPVKFIVRKDSSSKKEDYE